MSIVKRTIAFAPVIILVTIILILAICTFDLYQKPQYGKGENPNNLLITTYLAGDDQPTHPSLYDFGMPWNGWRYWMAYSPYPYGDGEEENPCIAVSNDLYNWTTPAGFHNPIAFNEETSCDELKDPHIVYNNYTDSIEVWYLGRINGTIATGSDLLLMRKTSKDGIKWSSFELMDTVNGTLSPSIIFKDGMYKYWSIQPSSEYNPGRLLYAESFNGKNWTPLKPCVFDGKLGINEIWHGAVALDSIFRFVFVESSGHSSNIMYTQSPDGINWTDPIPIIQKGTMRHHFYRPCIIASNDSVYCIYGTIDHNNRWGLAMSSGVTYMNLDNIQYNKDHHIFARFYIDKIKNLVDTIINIKICLVALMSSITLSFSFTSIRKNLSLIWLISWVLCYCYCYYFVGKYYISNTLDSCIILLLTSAISLVTAAASIGFHRKNK